MEEDIKDVKEIKKEEEIEKLVVNDLEIKFCSVFLVLNNDEEDDNYSKEDNVE